MKKTALLFCILTLSAVFMTACGMEESISDNSSSSAIPPAEAGSASQSEKEGDNALKLGLGVVSSSETSRAAEGENLGYANSESVICAVAVDSDGIIRRIKFDTVRISMPFDSKGSFTEEIMHPIRTLKEMGFEMGMAESSPLKQEWFQQVGYFEEWAVGKKVDDVLNMELNEQFVPISEELKDKMDIGVDTQLKALKKAFADAK